MQRRHFLKLVCGATAGPGLLMRTATAEGRAEPLPRLAAVAAAAGLQYGSTAEVDVTRQPEAYRRLLADHCHLFAPGYLSWSWISPSPDRYDFSREAGNLRFAASSGLALTGAHLLWQKRVPDWFKVITDPRRAEQAIRRHIAEMMVRFGPRSFSWNAVNEAIKPEQGRPDGLRADDPFLRVLGPRYIDLAFHAAHESAPSTLFAYNDFGLEADSPVAAARRRALLGLLDGLLQRGVPIAAVGLQSHLQLDDRFDAVLYRKFLAEIAGRGLKILITELDVNDRTGPADIRKRDQAVADCYERFLAPALDEKQVVALVTWGLSDRYTWLTPAYDPSYGRSDHLPCRPLPFDANFQPKPAYGAILRALRHAPPRPLVPLPNWGDRTAGVSDPPPPRT